MGLRLILSELCPEVVDSGFLRFQWNVRGSVRLLSESVLRIGMQKPSTCTDLPKPMFQDPPNGVRYPRKLKFKTSQVYLVLSLKTAQVERIRS